MTHWTPDISGYSGHRYRAVAEAIRDAILSGELRPDSKLLAHREMAWRLGVTIGTVAKAYQLLAEWGLVYAKVGDGTRIKEQEDSETRLVLGRKKERRVDFGLLLPSPLNDRALRKQAFADTLTKLGNDLLRKPITGYGPELGYESHRRAGASFMAESGYSAPPSEILVTDGVQEAIHLLLSVFSKPSDIVMTEEIGYLGFKTACSIQNRVIAPIAMDDQGIIPSCLESVATKTQSKLLFIVPNIQNPTGITLSLERRKQIAEISKRCGFYIIENNPFWAISGALPPPIVSLAPDNTFYVTSLSKYASPTLRIGYLRSDIKYIPDLEIAKHALSLTGSSLQAEVARTWIKTGIIYELANWQRKEIIARWEIAKQILGEYFPADNEAKPFLWLKLPTQWRSSEFISALKLEGVACIDSSHFTQGRSKELNSVRLALTTPDTQEHLKKGLLVVKDTLGKNPMMNLPLY
ncbi:PLP-dependent aminotransferase family protein [uncultured Pseudomonas sp.]|uniref:aminotransferase-like domain-containing protein n=1 Tax=uncultured Pseudomonas sp. TaxID=114707 RepID=UPI002607ED33|nr:PLP-dependent aminotransferase family protein [uncultured Pseudomonas sp.]